MRRRRKHERDDGRWNELARYNTEVGRGIVHTKEYDARMAIEQRAFNVWRLKTETVSEGYILMYGVQPREDADGSS